MGITERREKEKELIRKKIIFAASEILSEEGYEGLSIRKIANKIEYSPGIIYHYFKDKAEILTAVIDEGYGKILSSLKEISIDIDKPEKSIEEGLRAYIDNMLKTPEQFKAILMNDIEILQERVYMLKKGVSKDRESIRGLCKQLEIGVEKGRFREIDSELTAQIIWTSTYGLLSRLILEKDVPKEQKEELINHHFKIIFNGILK